MVSDEKVSCESRLMVFMVPLLKEASDSRPVACEVPCVLNLRDANNFIENLVESNVESFCVTKRLERSNLVPLAPAPEEAAAGDEGPAPPSDEEEAEGGGRLGASLMSRFCADSEEKKSAGVSRMAATLDLGNTPLTPLAGLTTSPSHHSDSLLRVSRTKSPWEKVSSLGSVTV